MPITKEEFKRRMGVFVQREKFDKEKSKQLVAVGNLNKHVEKAVIARELLALVRKVELATSRAGSGEYTEANSLLGEVANECTAAKGIADASHDAHKKLASWGRAPLRGLKAHKFASAIRDFIQPIENKLGQAETAFGTRNWADVQRLSGEIYWACDTAKSKIEEQAYAVARPEADNLIDDLEQHAQKDLIQTEITAAKDKRTEAARQAGLAAWAKALALILQVKPLCATGRARGDRFADKAAQIPDIVEAFQRDGVGEDEAKMLGQHAHRILALANFSPDKVREVAKLAVTLVGEGFDPERAATCAVVNQTLVDEGIETQKATEITRMTKTGGTATVEDALAVARGMTIFPAKMLGMMKTNGTALVPCRGGCTDHCSDLMGVPAPGWGGRTWDVIPGLHDGGTKEVIIGTMDGDTGRKVITRGDVSELPNGMKATHGTFDLIGHEAGHAFDFDGGDPKKSTNTKFRAAREKDIQAEALRGTKKATVTDATQPDYDPPGPDDYFLFVAEGGTRDGEWGYWESFAESCSRFFGGDAGMWPELKKFWRDENPWA